MKEKKKNAEIVNFFVRSAFLRVFFLLLFLEVLEAQKIAFYSLLLWIYSYGRNANVFVSEHVAPAPMKQWHEARCVAQKKKTLWSS